MSLVTNLQDLATRIATEVKTLRTLINGNALDNSALITTSKTNLVAAINEVAGAVANASGIDDTTTGTASSWSSSKTTAEIQAKVAAVVDAAPGTLDTLNELAAALGDDPNFATTITDALGNRVRFDAVQTLTAPQQVQARANIGAGTSNLAIGTTGTTAAAGNDARLSDARTPLAHTHTAANISDSTTVGRSVLTATDATAARTAIGAGTGSSNLTIGTTGTTAKAGDYQPTAANISDATTIGRTVLTSLDAAAVRTAIGAGTSNLAIGTTSSTAKAGDYAPPVATTLVSGTVTLATTAEATTGTDTAKAVTAAGVKAVGDTKAPLSHTHTAANISDSTATGRSVLTALDAAAARTAIGAGTGSSNLVIGTTVGTAKDGAYQPTAANISDASTVGRSVLTAIDAAAARTAIGAGTGTSNLTLGTTSSTAKAGDYAPPTATTAVSGTVTLASSAEATTGTDALKAITPATLKTVADTKAAASHTHTAANISDSTAVGRSVLTAVDATAARTAIGAGTSNLVIGTTAGTAADAAAVGNTNTDFVATFNAGLV